MLRKPLILRHWPWVLTLFPEHLTQKVHWLLHNHLDLDAPPSGQAPLSPETVTHWQEHFPWQFVTQQALNSRGEQIFYCVESHQDRMWAWRLERAVNHHRAVRERDLGKLSDMHARDLRELNDGPSSTGAFFGGGGSGSRSSRRGSLLCTRPFITVAAMGFNDQHGAHDSRDPL